MALVDEINTQGNTGEQNTAPQRPSLLVQHISQHGAEGLNQEYVNYALANGGGFGATAAGVVKDDSGKLNLLYNYTHRDRGEIEKNKALNRGDTIDTWYARAKEESEAATQRYNDLSTQLSDLSAKKNSQDNGSLFGSVMAKARGEETVSDEQISNLEKALQQADAAQKAAEEQLRYASSYKAYQKADQNAQTIEDARERGLSYKEIADSYGRSLDALNKEKQEALEQLRKAQNGAGYYGAASTYEEDKKRQEEDVKSALARLEDLQRQIDNITGLHTQALYRRPYDTGADAVIKQGEQLAKVAREQGMETAEANRSVKKVADYYSAMPRYSMIQNIASVFGINLPEMYNPVSFIAELGIRAGENAPKTPNDDWTKQQLDVYHVLYGDSDYGKDAAEKFAQMVNYAIKTEKIDEQKKPYYARGEDKGGTTGSKALKTIEGLIGAVPDMAFAAADYQDKLMDILATGEYAGHDKITTHEKFSAFSEGRAADLNRKTLSKEIPVIGGKGWGDIYQLGQSAIQSLASGHVLGEAATLGMFFFNAANSAFDEAMQRSGGNTKYATTYSLLSGAAEVIGEKVSLEHLLKGGKAGSLSFILKQAGIEGSEEVFTSLLNQFFDNVSASISGNQTAIQNQIDALVRQGMSYEDAQKQVWKETVSDLAWDFVGGAVSGGFSGMVEGAARGTRNQLWEMRKDSVLGKQNAEGQREGGKTNVSEDALRGLIDRALKRGDLRGAEELAQALQQKTSTAEEQEYGPADPRANEKMQGRLERQLNGERVNPREDAEVEGETEAKTPPALPEEFKDLNPVVAQQFARYEGRDLEMITRSMTRQEAYRYEQYLRAIGQTEKADLVERIRTDPNYHYEEQPPAYTDAEDPTRQRPQNAAGQQEAPGGQITQPQTQETAGVVKPQDSAQANNTLYNVTRNPYGVSTKGTESGTIATPNTQAIESSERTKANPQLEELASKAVASEKAKSESKETGTRFGTWFPSSQTDSKTTSAETKKDIATVKSSAKGNEYLRNDYRANISFAGNGQMYRSVSEAMADPSVSREHSLEDVVRAKFQQNRELREKLFATGDARIDPGTELGKILENVREELRSPDSPFNGRSAYEGAEDMGFNEFSDLLGREEERKREAERKLLEKFGYKEEENGELGTLSDSDGRRWGSLGNDGQRGTGLPGEAGQTQGRYQQENRRGQSPSWVTERDANRNEVSGKEKTGDSVFKLKGIGIVPDGAYIYGYGSYRIIRAATGTVADFVQSVLAKAFGTEANTVLVSGEIAVAGRPLERVIGGSNGVQIASSFKQYGSFREMTYGIRNYIHEVTHHVINDKFGGYNKDGEISDYNAYFARKEAIYAIVKSGFSKKDIAGNLKQPVDALCDYYLDDRGYQSSYELMGVEDEAKSRSARLGKFGTKEALRACVSEEILNDILGGNNNIMKAVDEGLITEENILTLREYFLQELVNSDIYKPEMASAVRNAHIALAANDFLYANGKPFVKSKVQAELERGDDRLTHTLRTLLSQNSAAIRDLSTDDLNYAINYTLKKINPDLDVGEKRRSYNVIANILSGENLSREGLRKNEDYATIGRAEGIMTRSANSKLFQNISFDLNGDADGYTDRSARKKNTDSIGYDRERWVLTAAINELDRRGLDIWGKEKSDKYSYNKENDNSDKDYFWTEEDDRWVGHDKEDLAAVENEEDASDYEESLDDNLRRYERKQAKRDLEKLRSGDNYAKEAIPTNPEDHGWIKPVEVSQKEVTRARDAVEAKDKLEEYKAKKALLQAHLDYYASVVDAMRKAREATYEQKVADLGYLADNVKEELEWLDEDMDKVASGVIGVEEEAIIDDIAIEKGNLNVQLDALRDEYKHLDKNDPESYQTIRKQIDSVLSQINVLNVRINNLSKRAAAADWGSNKRTLFQAEMAENPNGLRQKQTMPEPNVYGPYKIPELNKVFRQQVEAELDVDAEATDIKEPVRGMGTGYRGMQTSRNKDGSLEFRTMYDDALPTRPATDKSRKAIKAPSTAYGSVAQAARSILNSKSSFFNFSKDRPKDIPSKVTNAMGQLHEHVREMMEGEHPVNALMQISNMIREFENDDDLKVFTSDSIQKAVAELNDIYYNQDITNEEKAKRMVENATKTLSLISKRVQLVDRGYHMLKSFVGPRKKRDNTDFWSKYKAMQLNPSTLFKAMDGFARDKNGSGYQIAKMIENGTALYTITQAQALQKLSAVSGMEGFKEFSEGNTKPFDIDGVKITEQQAVEFIMQVRNLLATEVTGKDGPTNRLNTIEGFSIRDKDGKSTFIERSNDADGTNAEWFANLAEAFENSLSPAAKKYLEAATEILDELGQQASDIRTNLIGTGFDGSINGTYYPITYDSKNGKTNSQQSQPTGLASGPMYQSRTRNVGGYVNIKNASDTLDKYIHWASNFIGYGEVAELLRAMDNTGGRMQSLSGLADDMLGQGYSKYIEKYVNDVNEVPDGQKDNDSIWAKLRRNMASGALLGNLGVAAKQAASLWSAAGVLSPQAILSAETWFGKYSDAGNMLLQSRKIGTSLDPTISEILHNDSFMGKLMKRTRVSEFMGKATALVDYQTVKRLFAATVVDTKLSFPGLDQNSELFAQAVEAKFQDVVLQTQPIFVKNARAGYLRANDELTKAFAMFRTQPTQNLNAIVTAIGEYNALKGTEYGKAAGKKLRNTIIGQTASAVTFAVLSSLVGFARHGWKKYRDDDDELSWLEAAKRIGLDSVESLANLSVVGGDIAKAIITMATGGEEKEFYDMNTGVISMLGDTLSSVTTFGTNVFKAIQEGKPLAVFNAGRQAADNLLQVRYGIPANTVYRLLNTITMYSADALYALSDGKLGNRANYDDAMKMLDSYIKGNLTEEGAKTQAAKAFRKGQPENLLYNLGILSSLTKKDSKIDKGSDWLSTRIQGKNEAEREAYKADELARLGRNLNASERIANYLADSALSAAKKDEAISKFATSSGYNILYESLRAAGMTPNAAVAEIGSTENKNGLSTDIMDEENLAALHAGTDNPGTTNDVPALMERNTDEYVHYVSAIKVFKNTGNYKELDKLVDRYASLDENTRAVLEAKDSTLGKYRQYRAAGLSTRDYETVRSAIKDAQWELDANANTGSAVKLLGLSKTRLTDAQIQALIDNEAIDLSNTAQAALEVFSGYGWNKRDISMFLFNADSTNGESNGTLSNIEVAAQLARTPNLTDAQRSRIYEELKSRLSNYYNDWKNYSYESEVAYIQRKGLQLGKTA